MRLELKDLPPSMQRQALRIIAAEDGKKKKALSLMEKAKRAEPKRFDSKGEYEFYVGEVLPKLRSGEIRSCDEHPEFTLFEPGTFCGTSYKGIRYTADFMLTYRDSTVEIIEIKSRFVRRMQRDYPLRRRLFIEKYARPNGWKFREIITDERG